MAILSAEGKRKPRGIREARRCSVHNFGDERQCLQSSRPELFQQQEFSEIVEFAFVGDSENRAKPFQIDIRSMDFMTRWDAQPAGVPQCRIRMFANNFKKSLLCRLSLTIDEIHDGPEMFS